jgi:hypothetical protein
MAPELLRRDIAMPTKVVYFLFLVLLTAVLVTPGPDGTGKAVPAARGSGPMLDSPKPGDAG